MADVTDRPLRKDAERNRQRLLQAAGELFAQRGLDVTLNDVAHHAGVGVGTAYRRWGNKEELIDELFAQRLGDLLAASERALANPDPWDGLVGYLDESLRLQLEDRALQQLLDNPALGHQRINEVRDRNAPLVIQIVERAKAAGELRPDFEPTDLVFLQAALTALVERARTLHPDLYRRYLTMFLDGVRADRGPHSELPVAALSTDQTHAVVTSGRPLPPTTTSPAGSSTPHWTRESTSSTPPTSTAPESRRRSSARP